MTVRNLSSVSDSLIADELAEVQKFLSEQLNCPDDRLAAFIDYLKHRQGKMLRASVLLLSGRLFGDINKIHIEIAAVVEMIHAATLLHDDVIDDGRSRRGHATANNLWGANLAVLLGDYLLSKAFLTMESLQRNDISRILTDTAATICQGEMLQNALRGDSAIGVEEYLEIIEKKTAVFFANCGRLGAIISEADENDCEALYDFGLNLGMAFQITDDLIDIVGKESETGKTGGRDVENKILTLPAIKSIDFAKSQIVHYRQKAVSSLAGFDPNPAALALKELADSVTQLPL
ncbi:MAG: polyprenyl synthetase family protein, partial [Planctomycetes bacterium]|nr:polyprenyl synthetase family protein [Planctomycetota bacterium]MBU1517667.1 polyprenyl synthetase family protein [Planctomycetota bacterium]MBU2458709.1 polyprenyl synthetase family protein [Planctomycetota bacterium]MBU2597140.1 polyprenyl synthetase family protein [Planctomycetota bacterium]